MKITVISNLYKPFTRGGAERVVELTVQGLIEAGHEVVVISTKPTAGLEKEINKNKTIYRFKPMNLFYYLDDHKHAPFVRLLWHVIDMFNTNSMFIVKLILELEKPELVITHNLKGLGFLVPFIIRLKKIKHIHILHDVQLSVPSGLIIKGHENDFIVSGLPTQIYESICRALFGSPDVVVSPSKWLMDFYAQRKFFPNSQKKILPNPIVEMPRTIATQNTDKKFLFLGQLEKHKGIDWLIDIWNKNQIQSELFIAGSGNLNLQPGNEKIKVLGKVASEDLPKIFEVIDFLILPTLCYENSPMVIPESFMNSKPVIVADIGGAAELVHDGETGFVFEAGNEESFLQKIKTAQSVEPEKYLEMQENCFTKAKTMNLSEYIAKLLEF